MYRKLIVQDIDRMIHQNLGDGRNLIEKEHIYKLLYINARMSGISSIYPHKMVK